MAIFLYVLSSAASLAAVSAVLFPLCIFVYLIRRFSSDAQLPASLPWAGVAPEGGRYGRLRANLRGFFGMESLLDEGYTKVRWPTTRLPARDLLFSLAQEKKKQPGQERN